MSYTAHKTQQQKKQYFDSQQVLDKKVAKLADLILKSKHFIAFTGAGISTACGVRDFRSGVNTVLKTGAGVWQKRAINQQSKPNKNLVHLSKALPSLSHMTLVALQEGGFLKYLVSQNVDGLHVRSGFDTYKLAELHGNRCLEKCKNCGSQYLRDFKTRQAGSVHDHKTSRKCEKCKGMLFDSIINFKQNLPEQELERSYKEAEEADLCLAMGSSLTVTPASDIPKITSKKGKLVIINLQETPLDYSAHMRINALCDDVMIRLAEKLELKVREFTLRRLIEFKKNSQKQIQIRGIDNRGLPFSFFKNVVIQYENQEPETLKNQPFKIPISQKQPTVSFQFYGYLDEPAVELDWSSVREGKLMIQYDPQQGQWVNFQWQKSNDK